MNRKVLDIINDASNLEFVLKENEELVINFYHDNLDDIDINITQESNSNFILNFVALLQKDVSVNISGLIKGDNNKNVINVRTIAEKGISTFNVSVKANEGTKDNEIIEDLKGINEEGGLTLLPILEIDTMEVNAAHYATVGTFDKNQVFYLLSKGISKDNVYNMLKRSFLHSILSNDLIEKIERK